VDYFNSVLDKSLQLTKMDQGDWKLASNAGDFVPRAFDFRRFLPFFGLHLRNNWKCAFLRYQIV
jgi:hypothetical protein